MTGLDIKILYMKNNKIDPKKFRLRLFNKGFEIKDEHKLYTHNINKESNVQVAVKEIENE